MVVQRFKTVTAAHLFLVRDEGILLLRREKVDLDTLETTTIL